MFAAGLRAGARYGRQAADAVKAAIPKARVTPPVRNKLTMTHKSVAGISTPAIPPIRTVTRATADPIKEETTTPSQLPKDLDPRALGYDEAFVTRLAIKIKDRVQKLGPNGARSIINRTGIDGMSLGALPAPQWYGLVLVTQITRVMIANVYDADTIPRDTGFEMSAGEGGIPPVRQIFDGYQKVLKDGQGRTLMTYNAALFEPTVDQDASGQFKNGPSSHLKSELKGGQNAKDAIGGRLPGAKNQGGISFLRNITSGIDVPSPNNVPFTRSVEDLTVWRIFKELLNGVKPDIKVSTAYNFIDRALAVVRANAGLNIAGGREGRTGGTGSTSSNYRDNTVMDGLTAVRAFVEAMDTLGIDTNIAFSNNIFGVKDLVESLIVADRARIATLALILLQNCRYAKTCDKACPVNITTGADKYDIETVLENVDDFFDFFERAEAFAEELGVAHLLNGGRCTQEVIRTILKPNPNYPDQAYAEWMAYQTDSSGQETQPKRKTVEPSPGNSRAQHDDEDQVLSEANAGKTAIRVPGAPGAIGFFARVQRDPEVLMDKKITVDEGGTYFGGANQYLDLYTQRAADFMAKEQIGPSGSVTAVSAGRQAAIGAQGGYVNVAHAGSEAGYRAGCTYTGETVGDSYGHYAGNMTSVIAGRAVDYPAAFKIEDNQDYPANRAQSIGYNPFAASAGSSSIIPKTTWEHLTATDQIQGESYMRLMQTPIDDAKQVRIEAQLRYYQDKMTYLTGEDRKIVTSLLNALKIGADPNELFVWIQTNPEFKESVHPTMQAYLKEYANLYE